MSSQMLYTSRTCTDGIPPMIPSQAGTMLQLMGLGREATLPQLQWSFIRTFTFHNIDLLAQTSPKTPRDCIHAVLNGRGGPCHVACTAFISLLRALGFDAYLAAATIGQPNDHLVAIVRCKESSFVCDVGNGHPYTHPFSLCGRTQINYLGWRFTSHGNGSQLCLIRHMPDGTTKLVYTVHSELVHFDDFKTTIEKHHNQVDFGPFLTGLRAVRIQENLIVTLRDQVLTRYSRSRRTERSILREEDALRVLHTLFDLDETHSRCALERLRPSMAFSATQSETPRIVVSLTTTARPDNLQRVLRSLARVWKQTAKKATQLLHVLIVENSPQDPERHANRCVLTKVREDCPELLLRVVDSDPYGLPIALSRIRQTRELECWLDEGDGFDCIWMLDDDIELEQLFMADGCHFSTRDVPYFDHIVDLYQDHPEVSVLIGGVCGDPPIRPEAVMATQLLDISANLEHFAKLNPKLCYPLLDQTDIFQLPDYYYDHSRAGDRHLETPFMWTGSGRDTTVRAEALAFLKAASGIVWGATPMRPMIAYPPKRDRSVSLLRGGNTVFLDVDACFRHTYPTFTHNGVTSRRSDMIGAALLHREGGTHFVDFPYPVRHCRLPSQMYTSPEVVLNSVKAEHVGVVITRLLTDYTRHDALKSCDVERISDDRCARVVSRIRLAQERVKEAQNQLAHARASWIGEEPDMCGELAHLDRALHMIQETCLGGAYPQKWLEDLKQVMNGAVRSASFYKYIQTDIRVRVHALNGGSTAHG